jgi:glycerol uptake facilitator-like aquaporin
MGTAFLLFVICIVTDPLGPIKKNGALYAPMCVAMAIYVIGSAFGYNCGYAGKKTKKLFD